MTPFAGVTRAIQLDLPVELGDVENRSVNEVGVVDGEPGFTAARLVAVPPIATTASGRGRLSRRSNSDESAASAASSVFAIDRRGEAEPLRHPALHLGRG